MKDIVVKSKFGKNILGIIMDLIFLFLSGLLLKSSFTDYFGLKFGFNFMGALLFIVGIFGLFTYIYSLIKSIISLKSRIVLTVTDDGILNNTNGIKWGLVDWIDIEEIRERTHLGQYYIEIKVNNIEKYVNRLSIISRFYQRQNMKMGFNIIITTNTLDCESHWLFVQIENYFNYIKENHNKES